MSTNTPSKIISFFQQRRNLNKTAYERKFVTFQQMVDADMAVMSDALDDLNKIGVGSEEAAGLLYQAMDNKEAYII